MTFRASAFFLIASCSLLSACGNETQRLEQSRLGDFARFGRSIDVSGTRAVVSAYQENSSEGAVYIFTRLTDTWSLEARLVSPNPDDEQFGDSVAVSGNTVVVGAPMDDQAGAFRSGSVYVFERASDGTWPLAQTLSSQGGHQAWEAFGVEVAIDGNLIAVGAVDRDQAGQTDAGGVFVFERSGTSWSYLQQLTAPMPVAQDKFGNAIDIAGTNIAVAALRRDRGAVTDAGAVYVYTRPGALFSLAQSIQPRDGLANDLFGSDVALEVASGGARRLVIGAEGCDPGNVSNAGAVYVYDSPGAAALTQTQKLLAGDPAPGAIFGTAVALAGTRIAVGAPSFNGAAPQSGAAYTFALSGTWTQQQKLERNPSDANATYGNAVAMVGTNLLIGASNESIGTLFDYTGAAHAYLEVAGSYEHMHVLTAQGSQASQNYGLRLSLGGDTMAVLGASHVDVYRRDAYGWSEEQHLPGPTPSTLTGVAADGSTVAIAGRRTGAMFPTPQGFIQVYVRTGDTWTMQQELLPDLASASLPAESANSLVLDLEGDTLVLGERRRRPRVRVRARGRRVDAVANVHVAAASQQLRYELRQPSAARRQHVVDRRGAFVGCAGQPAERQRVRVHARQWRCGLRAAASVERAGTGRERLLRPGPRDRRQPARDALGQWHAARLSPHRRHVQRNLEHTITRRRRRCAVGSWARAQRRSTRGRRIERDGR
jgi:hypothetical protein